MLKRPVTGTIREAGTHTIDLSRKAESHSDCSRKQVIAVGRYMPQKGFDRLISAWKIVSQKRLINFFIKLGSQGGLNSR